MHLQLNIQQTQKLVMTPKLQQAITILQYSREELLEKINDEMLSNPLLETDDGGSEIKQLISHFSNNNGVESTGGKIKDEESDSSTYMEHFSENRCSLNEHLRQQLCLYLNSKEEMRIGCYILEYIDQDGYFKGNLEDIAYKLQQTNSTVEKILNIIQTFEPSGVGARDLQECLLIQFNQLPSSKRQKYQCVEAIIKQHLYDLGQKKYKKISKTLHISDELLREAIRVIHSFTPKPGASFDEAGKVEYIVPDITVREINGEFFILHDTSCYPRLRINQFYAKLLEKKADDSHLDDYIRERIDAALWFIKNIEHRHYIVYQVMEKILEFQEAFFRYGSHYLKPLNLKDISQVLNIHESTVSRVVRNKYVQTKWGIYELKYFFPSMVNKSDGGHISNEVIKQMIKNFVEAENPQTPYSDQQLTELLQEKNIEISRRAIAKYRSEMEIPCASQRKIL